MKDADAIGARAPKDELTRRRIGNVQRRSVELPADPQLAVGLTVATRPPRIRSNERGRRRNTEDESMPRKPLACSTT